MPGAVNIAVPGAVKNEGRRKKMVAVTLSDMALLLDNAIQVYTPYFKMVFSMMLAFYILFGIRKLLVGNY